MLSILHARYPGLSDVDLLRLALSDYCYRMQSEDKTYPFTSEKAKKLDRILDEVERGEVVGPFNSADELISSLRK